MAEGAGESTEKIVKDIWRKTCWCYSADEKKSGSGVAYQKRSRFLALPDISKLRESRHF
jgi:hypothetical protein